MFEALALNLTSPSVTIPLVEANFTNYRIQSRRVSERLVSDSDVRSNAVHADMSQKLNFDDGPDWLKTSRQRFGAALALPDGWDGPASYSVSREVAFYAERLTEFALQSVDQPLAPYVVPLPDGGLQVEWHSVTTEIEVYFDNEGNVSAWAHNRQTGFEVEKEGVAAVQLLKRWAQRLGTKVDLQVAEPLVQAA